MASSKRMPLPVLTDDILTEIFIRLPTPEDLARTSASCTTFRRLINDRSFLRRFRSLNAPPFLGFLDHKGFHHVVQPHPSAAVAGAVARAGDFTFTFLPSPGLWLVCDVVDGRVLVDRHPNRKDGHREWPSIFYDLAVCDPLHRRYVLLPPIPHDLAASVQHPYKLGCREWWMEPQRWIEPFFAPGCEEDAATEANRTSFRVICMAQCKEKLVAFVFSSSTGHWRSFASLRWSDLFPGSEETQWQVLGRRKYACGCFYWMKKSSWGKLLVLDARRMEFSVSTRSPEYPMPNFTIVDAGEGMTGMFTWRYQQDDLYYTIRRKEGDCSERWKLEKIIRLGREFRAVRAAVGMHLLLELALSPRKERTKTFSLDFKTWQLKRVYGLEYGAPQSYIYTNFPPLLSSEAI